LVNEIVVQPKKVHKNTLPPPKKYNWKLRKQREQDTVEEDGFPLVIRTKPTAHEQYCLVCRNRMEKGEKQIKLPYGMWAMYKGERHAIAVYDKMGGANLRYYTRHVYLHTDCFGCIINKMMLKADLPHLQVKLVCDNCRNRFNCWTGNRDEEWREGLPKYVPSRPCGNNGND